VVTQENSLWLRHMVHASCPSCCALACAAWWQWCGRTLGIIGATMKTNKRMPV
jgi:hypothetical protein